MRSPLQTPTDTDNGGRTNIKLESQSTIYTPGINTKENFIVTFFNYINIYSKSYNWNNYIWGVDPDAAAGDGGELTPKQEPFDDSAAVVHDESAANYPAADSSEIYPAADSAAAIYPAADNPAGGYSAAGNAGSHGFVIPDTATGDTQ